jgi:cystathionine beta-lyase
MHRETRERCGGTGHGADPAFNFDVQIDRRRTDSSKWRKYAGRDVLPLWVADLDFAAPSAVLEALHGRVHHGIFGYGDPPESAVEALIEALARDHGWHIDPAWLIWLPGLVTGINVACRAVGGPGDAVFTATPIYPPFLSAPRYSERQVVTAPLQRVGSRWKWDLDRVQAALVPDTRLFLLCNPHNPVGRVFTREELLEIGGVAERRDLIICSDEIHAGLVLDPSCTHLPIAALDEALARRTITLMAPSKTYNIPGLGCAFAVVSSPTLHRRVREVMRGIVPHVNVLGYAAAEAAWRHGEPWRRALVDYLRRNAQRVGEAVGAMPGLRTTPVEATYLSWIDATALGVENPAAHFEAAGVGLSNGADFGAPGFVRLNFGCTRATLDEALARISAAVAAAP